MYDIALTIENLTGPSVEPALLRDLAEAALAFEGAPAGSVSLVITDDATVQRLNAEYRGMDEPTDVLSFGLGGLAQPAEDTGVEEPFVLPEGTPLEIGEIVISYPYAARTAAATNRPVRDELALLVVHGVLHLLGRDHYDDVEGDEMRRREREILGRFGIERG
jgi:probable rRNA maturation factor